MDGVFSPKELEILEVIGKKRMTVSEIVEAMEYHVFDANNIVAGVIRRINRKCEEKQLPWFLNGEGSGRGGRTVWKEKRNAGTNERSV